MASPDTSHKRRSVVPPGTLNSARLCVLGKAALGEGRVGIRGSEPAAGWGWESTHGRAPRGHLTAQRGPPSWAVAGQADRQSLRS